MPRNFDAHLATSQQLAGFVTLLAEDELAFYSALFKFIFRYQHTEVDSQSDDAFRQILTNCGSRRLTASNLIVSSGQWRYF